jgi:hypothetical protein
VLRPNVLRLATTRSGELTDALGQALVAGGDTRLRLDAQTGLNGYGCRPLPQPSELSFSSSTASTISESACAAVEAAFRDLRGAGIGGAADGAFDALTEKVRDDLKGLLHLRDAEVEVVLSPSGTDAELQALYVARCVLEKPITGVIVAADETGSGVGLAAAGRHFDSVTSGGRPVVKGEPIAGLATEGPCIPVVVRDRDGCPLPVWAVDEEVRHFVAQATAAGRSVILHVMNHAKTGGHYPSVACLRDVIATHSSAVQVVVDACQTRLSRTRLRQYLDLGCMVLITGSKFFAGPPLSGALLVPAALAARMAGAADVPSGLADYTTPYDWPKSWTRVRSALPKREPIGPLLRWVAAIAEMRGYFAVPEFIRKLALKEFAAVVARSIAQYPHLQLVATDAGTQDDEEFDVPTVFPLLVKRAARPLSYTRSRLLHRALNQDVSGLLRGAVTSAERDLAARLCHLGQPVAIADGAGGTAGAIRISADARFVRECWSQSDQTFAVEKMRRRLGDARTVLDKLQLLLQNFDVIEEAYAT